MNARSRALAAYGAPIEAHARDFAAGVLDSIECDMRARVTGSYAEGLEDVVPPDEWKGSGAPEALSVPAGALDWARATWCSAFGAELRRLVAERSALRSDRVAAFVRGYLGDLDAGRP